MKIIINPETHKVFLEDSLGNRMFIRSFSTNVDATNFGEELRQTIKTAKVYIQDEANSIFIPKKEVSN